MKQVKKMNLEIFIYDNLPNYEYVDVEYDTFRWIKKFSW